LRYDIAQKSRKGWGTHECPSSEKWNLICGNFGGNYFRGKQFPIEATSSLKKSNNGAPTRRCGRAGLGNPEKEETDVSFTDKTAHTTKRELGC